MTLRELITTGVLIALVTVLFFSDIVFFGKTFGSAGTKMPGVTLEGPWGYRGTNVGNSLPVLDPAAPAWQFEPSARVVNNILADGELPLWSKFTAMGTPLAADMQVAVYYPLMWPIFAFPTELAWDLLCLLRIFLLGLFTYLFTRSIGLGRLPSLCAVFGYMFSGWYLLYVRHVELNVYLLMPLLMWSFQRLFRRITIGTLTTTAMIVGLAIFGGHPEALFAVVLFGSAFYIHLVLLDAWRKRSLRHGLIGLGSLALIGIFSAVLGAVQLLPFLELLREGFTTHSPEAGVGLFVLSPATAISILFPWFMGKNIAGWSSLGWKVVGGYESAVLLVLALFAFRRDIVRSNTEPHYHLSKSFFAVVPILILLKSYGFPYLQWLGQLPLLELVIFPRFFYPLFSFSLAILGAIGMQHCLEAPPSLKTIAARFLLIVAVILAYLWYFYPSIKVHGKGDSVHTQILILTLFLVFSFLLLNLNKISNQRTRLVVIGLFPLIVLGELYWKSPKQRGDRYNYFTSAPFVSYLSGIQNEAREPARIFAFDGYLWPNTSSVYNLEDIRNMNAVHLERYYRFITNTFVSALTGNFMFSGMERELHSERLPTIRYLEFLNVRHLIVSAPFSLPEPWQVEFLRRAKILMPAGEKLPYSQQAYSRPDFFEIERVRRPVIYQHPPATMEYPYTVPDPAPTLRFSVTLHPDVWGKPGNGVIFSIYVRSGKKVIPVYSQLVNPHENPDHRRWFNGTVSLDQFTGQSIVLVFKVDDRQDPRSDWAGWAGLASLGKDESTEKCYPRLEYEGEDALVYYLSCALPRAFLLNKAKTFGSVDEVFQAIGSGDYDFKQTALLDSGFTEQEILDPEIPVSDMHSAVKFKHHGHNRVVLDVRTPKPGILVLTDTYSPGWTVAVNGEDRDVFPVDGVFRGVLLPAGNHVVEFSYFPLSFQVGAWLSLVGWVCVVGIYLTTTLYKQLFKPFRRQLGPRVKSGFEGGNRRAVFSLFSYDFPGKDKPT
jgi:hypothetical protein